MIIELNDYIWDDWADAIMNNLKLKDWVTIALLNNGISENKAKDLKAWVQWYKDRWINCDVILDESEFGI